MIFNKNISNELLNLLDYYSSLNVNNFFNDTITQKSTKKSNRLNTFQHILELTKKQLNILNNDIVFRGNPLSKVLVLNGFISNEDSKSSKLFNVTVYDLLVKMLLAINIKEEDFFLTNLSFSKNIHDEKSKTFNLFFRKILPIIKPNIILLLGKFSYNNLLSKNKIIDDIHGKFENVDINGIDYTITTTYHPEDLIHNPDLKKNAWNDLKALKFKLL
ncbi:MAG: uracil-DNA glycosylase family protein [Candidatus Fonsibacter sp.]